MVKALDFSPLPNNQVVGRDLQLRSPAVAYVPSRSGPFSNASDPLKSGSKGRNKQREKLRDGCGEKQKKGSKRKRVGGAPDPTFGTPRIEN